jgi:hypothetical protein
VLVPLHRRRGVFSMPSTRCPSCGRNIEIAADQVLGDVACPHCSVEFVPLTGEMRRDSKVEESSDGPGPSHPPPIPSALLYRRRRRPVPRRLRRRRAGNFLLKLLGWLFFAAGWPVSTGGSSQAAYYGLFFNTSGWGDFGPVANLSLIDQRQAGLMLSLGMAVAGLMISGLGLLLVLVGQRGRG